MRDFLQQLAVQLKLGDACTFHGQLPRDALMDLYSEVDAFLFPSLHDSGGTVVLEALSRGLPVICVDLGGPPNFVDESCGYVIPARFSTEDEVVNGLADAIAELHSSRERLKRLANGALARAEAMSWEQQVRFVYEDIAEVLQAA
jgi:glycosyltransferase involved in cell wall biosynthesis